MPLKPMLVSEPVTTAANGVVERSAAITAGSATHTVWYRVSGAGVAEDANAFLAAALIPAMRTGRDLKVAGRVSPRLLDAVPAIQDVLCSWYPDFRRVAVEARASGGAGLLSGRGSACFFSGGVDSLYSAIKHLERLDAFIFVEGFDLKLHQTGLRRTVAAAMAAAALEFDRPLVRVETNLREFSNRYASWGPHYFGSALGSVALLLSPAFSRVYLAASMGYGQLFPWGSSPLLDPLWSTEAMEVIHDGCEARRVEKVARLGASPIALKHLRVCYENPNGQYNCGRCEKCLRTMTALRVTGGLERCQTFQAPLEPHRVARVKQSGQAGPYFYRECLEVLERSGQDPVLAQAIRDSLDGVYASGLRGWPRRAINRVRRLRPVTK